MAQHGQFHFLFLNSAILHSCIFGYSCSSICWNFIYYLTSINYFSWIVLVCIYSHAFRYILGFFYPPCLYLGEEHVSWSTYSHKWHVFAIMFLFMSCPEPPMGKSGVGSFPVWSGGSLILFQLFRCRNLALNRFFPTFLSGRHVFILGGHLDSPTFTHPYMFICSQGFKYPPYVPNTPLCICMFSETSACCGGL